MDKKKSANIVLGVISLIFSAAIAMASRSTGLQFYRGTTPGQAFVPFIAAGGIALCGLALIVNALKSAKGSDTASEKEKDTGAIWIFKRSELWNFSVVIGTSILMVYFARYLGMLTSLAIGTAVMSKLLGTPGWRTPVFVGVFSWVLFYLIFDLFLRVPLPRGMLGI